MSDLNTTSGLFQIHERTICIRRWPAQVASTWEAQPGPPGPRASFLRWGYDDDPGARRRPRTATSARWARASVDRGSTATRSSSRPRCGSATTATPRPCTPSTRAPASSASTSSRRRPDTRRLPPCAGRPACPGVTRARRELRNSFTSARRSVIPDGMPRRRPALASGAACVHLLDARSRRRTMRR